MTPEVHVYIRSGSGWKAVNIYHPLDKYHLTLVIVYLSPAQQHLNLTDRSLEKALGKQGFLSLLAAVVGFYFSGFFSACCNGISIDITGSWFWCSL